MLLTVEFGDYKCSSTSASSVCTTSFTTRSYIALSFHNWLIITLIIQAGGNNETICALKDVDGDQSLPPVSNDAAKRLTIFYYPRWMWRWTLEMGVESRFGVGKTRVNCGFTNTRCLDSTGSQFQVGCQFHLKISNHGFSFLACSHLCF